MYLTYDDYEEYGGTLDDTTFEDYEWEAETIVNWYTFNRLKGETTYPVELKRCMYRLIQLAQQKAELLAAVTPNNSSGGVSTSTSGTVASMSNDGVSISYNVMSASEVFGILNSKESGNLIEDTVRRYLHGVTNSLGRKLLYRGLYPDE